MIGYIQNVSKLIVSQIINMMSPPINQNHD